MSESIENKIFSRIIGKKKGWVFTPSHFLDLGNRAAIDQSLSRLVRSGGIRRLARGLYNYPQYHPDFGVLPANVDRITKALAEKDNLKLQPTGAYAANLLGLSDQVPAKVVFLTDGNARIVRLGKLSIRFKKTTPKNMATAGRVSGLVIQALRYLKQKHVDDKIIRILRRRLSNEDKRQLINDIRFAPAWVGAIFQRLQEQENL